MSRANDLREWRKMAREDAVSEGYDRDNVQVKTFKTGKTVLNSKGVAVEELVPVTTYTQTYKVDSYKGLYKEMKSV